MPDYVLFPCARGNGLYGCWKGFQDALEWGWTSAAPHMVGCQPALANSLEVSIASNAERAVETAPAQSVARSISETVTGDHAIGAVRQSHGAALSATEDEISAAQRLLGQHGINTEAASATTLACLAKLTRQRALRGDETIVSPHRPWLSLAAGGPAIGLVCQAAPIDDAAGDHLRGNLQIADRHGFIDRVHLRAEARPENDGRRLGVLDEIARVGTPTRPLTSGARSSTRR